MEPRQTTVNITNRTIVRTIVWILATIIFYRFVGKISHGLTLIFASFFLALALNPVVSWLSVRLKLKTRVRATALAYLLVVSLITLFIVMVAPPLVRQTRTFIGTVPSSIENFQQQDSKLAQEVRKYKLDEKITKSAKEFASHYSDYGSTILDTGRRIVEAVASVLVVLVMTFMMLVEGPAWLERFWKVMPPKHQDRQKKIAHKMYRGVTGFVNGQVILALIAGMFAFLALEISSRILDVEINAVALAGIVAVFGLIPLFGNPLAAILVILACLINSVTLGIVMLIYFIVYFFVENHTFQPYIQSRLNQLTPLTVFIAAILGVGFGGLLGAIIAIPAATAVKILVEDHFEHRAKPETTT